MNLTVTICQGIVMLALGVLGGFVLIKRPNHRAGQFLTILCLLTCGWIAAEMATDPFEAVGDVSKALLLRNFTKSFASFMAATLIGFAWYFPKKSPAIRQRHLILIYLIALIFAIGAFTPYDAIPRGIRNGTLELEYGWLHDLYTIYIVACGLYALGTLLYKYIKFESSIARLQIQYVTFGLGLTFLIGTVFDLLLPRLASTRYFFVGTLAPAIGCFFMAYAIVKYRAMEIETAIHRTFIWILISSVVLLPISGTIYLMRNWLHNLSNGSLALVATAFFFLFFVYTRKVQPVIDRLFQQDDYAMQREIERLMEQVCQLKDLPALAYQILRTTQWVFHVPRVTLLVYREAAGAYELIDVDSERQIDLKSDDPFVRWLVKSDAILEREQVELQPQHAAIRDAAREYFQRLSAEVCVPFVHEGQLIGALNLGRRARKRWSFTKHEIDLLARLRAPVTLALENSLLHETRLSLQEKQVQVELIATASSALAHSIKNPLGLLDANLDLLRDTLAPLEDEGVDFAISEVEAQIRRIERIVNQIRNANIGTPDLAPCDLNLVIGEALAEVKQANPHSSIQVNLSRIEMPEILGDARQLQLAFINLIANAYQAMGTAGGTLTIHAKETAFQNTPVVCVEVEDTGCGMPAELIQQITTRPFITRKKTGTGLGVWTTRKIVEAHGGRLAFNSQEGVGTTAIVMIPTLPPSPL